MSTLLEVRQFLTLSTGHVSEATAQMLETTPIKDWPVCGGHFGTYGWFMYAHDEDCEGDIPPELMVIFDYARANGCNYVLFDCDGDTVDQLPTFDW